MKFHFLSSKRKILCVIIFSIVIFYLKRRYFSNSLASSNVKLGVYRLKAEAAHPLRREHIPHWNFTNSTEHSRGEYRVADNSKDLNSHRLPDSFSCAQLLVKNGAINKTTVSVRNDYLKSHIIEDKNYKTLARNCTEFTSDRGYFRYRVSQKELDFPLAYGIYMYKSVHQVEQLLRTIYRPHNVYCVHVDSKASQDIHESMQGIAKCFENVFIPSRLARVTWGSIEVVKAELYCLSDLFKSPEMWKYYLNLSGQEFPLKTNLEIVQILTEYHGLSDVMSTSKKNMFPKRQKFKYFIGKADIMVNSKVPYTVPKPFEGPIFKGELHVALSREFATFILQSEIAWSWFTWLNETFCPDEYFYQTLSRLPGIPGVLGNNASEFVAQMSRAKMWEKPHVKCQGKFVREICVYSWRGLPNLAKRPQLFANKFHADYDSVVLECLSELIQNRTDHPIKLNIPFYRNFSTFRSLESVTHQQDWFFSEA